MLLKVKTNASRCCLWAKEEAVRGVARHERREKMASGCDILEEFVMVAGVEWATKHSGYTDRKFTLETLHSFNENHQISKWKFIFI